MTERNEVMSLAVDNLTPNSPFDEPTRYGDYREGQRFFTDREHPLALLALSRNLLAQGIRKHLALSGSRRVGKTVILKEFLRRHLAERTHSLAGVAYLDLPRLALTPEASAAQYIGHLLYWLGGQQGGSSPISILPSN